MVRLYKRTSTGAIQVWWMELGPDGRYRTHSGQEGGVVTTSEWTVCVSKNIGRSNETDPDQQAKSEVEAAYVLKRKKGYTDTPDAARASTKFSPMLAKKFVDYEDKLFKGAKVFSQPKLDGIRCIARVDGLKSRMGNPICSVPHISEALSGIFVANPDLVLDGELYNHDLREDFNTIISLSKKQKPTAADLAESARLIQFWVYDSPGPELFEDRIARVRRLLAGIRRVVVVPTALTPDRMILDEHYQSYLENGYEGQIIRVNAPYEQKRTDVLLKRKEFEDSEFEVCMIEEGVGNGSGIAKRCFLRLDTDPSRVFKADIMGTREYTRDILRNRERLIGKKATVRYFKQRTPDGIPRFGKVVTFHETERW